MSSSVGNVQLPQTSSGGIFGFLSSKTAWASYIPIIIGIILVSIASTVSNGNDGIKGNYYAGGSFAIILGVAIAFMTSGLFAKAKAFAESGAFKGVSGGSMFTLLLAVVVTVAVFVGLFYNYSPPDVVPFSAVILSIIAVLGAIGLLYTFSGKDQLANGITRFAFTLSYFLPYAVFTFGIISDILSRSIQYVPASFTGLTGVLLNYAIGLIRNNGVAPPVQNALCEIPGLSQFSSVLVPQSMMFTLSSIAYIATYISRSKIGSGFVVDEAYRWPAWALYFGVWGFQLILLTAQGCMTPQKAIGGLLAPLGWGGIMGLIGFSVLETRNQPAGPVAPGVPLIGGKGGKRRCKDGNVPGINGRCPEDPEELASSTPTCSAGSGDGEFVCESFKNGKLETSVITE